METQDKRKKITGVLSRRRFQALAAAGVLSIGLGIGAVGDAFAAPAPQTFLADATPVASPVASGTAHPRGGPGWGGHGPGGFFGPVATFLGVSETDLQTALTSQTLAQVAVAHGKTAADLKAFLTSQLKTRLDADVTAGRITSQQETDQLHSDEHERSSGGSPGQ